MFGVYVKCDHCSKVLDTGYSRFLDAWQFAEMNGWNTWVNEKGQRLHYCSEECLRESFER